MSFLVLPRRRRWLAGAYVLVVLFATWQRGVHSQEHTTFAIFRQSYVHLVEYRDLYAVYPSEHGHAIQDTFKYSPTAAVLFAPLSALPYAFALLCWNLLNAGLLFLAVSRILPLREANIALAMLLPEVFTTIQASSSNALIAALMLLAMGWIAGGRHVRAATAIAVGTCIKIFPIAAIVMAATRRDWRRLALFVVLALVILAVLPLLVIPAQDLADQYRSWRLIQLRDAADVDFGMSLIRAVRVAWTAAPPNWVFQFAGTVLVLVPLLRRERWHDAQFRTHLGASLLTFVVLFNHQAERQSLVIAATGCAIWLVSRPFSVGLALCYLLALTGASVVPYAVLWLALQADLAGDLPARVLLSSRRRLATVSRAMHPPPCRTCGGAFAQMQPGCDDHRFHPLQWARSSLPQHAVRIALLTSVVDLFTPEHFLFPLNIWDLLR